MEVEQQLLIAQLPQAQHRLRFPPRGAAGNGSVAACAARRGAFLLKHVSFFLFFSFSFLFSLRSSILNNFFFRHPSGAVVFPY